MHFFMKGQQKRSPEHWSEWKQVSHWPRVPDRLAPEAQLGIGGRATGGGDRGDGGGGAGGGGGGGGAHPHCGEAHCRTGKVQ
mmetsp:Transcript_50233/g.162796  ORF Transcript_50233/g.162796 Transcript_50233/m.162796 type:complete len:82 (+) Transcript_50233:337-582(+)